MCGSGRYRVLDGATCGLGSSAIGSRASAVRGVRLMQSIRRGCVEGAADHAAANACVCVCVVLHVKPRSLRRIGLPYTIASCKASTNKQTIVRNFEAFIMILLRLY